MRHLIIMSNN